ncbi:MAG: 50S ribosomal protein L29 [Fimbriimonadales bacterium]|nr:50S ribosomal protein L29 [Fimbriimonadales bacterium]MDW8051357.1 50S ribosomal protein L29 [Armatimonadota bacterium]
MKPLKPDQLRRMTMAELQKELDNMRMELYRLRVQKTIGQLKDTDSIRQLKRNIARVLTIINEKRRQAGN